VGRGLLYGPFPMNPPHQPVLRHLHGPQCRSKDSCFAMYMYMYSQVYIFENNLKKNKKNPTTFNRVTRALLSLERHWGPCKWRRTGWWGGFIGNGPYSKPLPTNNEVNNLPTDLRNSSSQQMFKYELRKGYDIPDKPQLYFCNLYQNCIIIYISFF
jgi:hypothetical protein